MLKDRVFLFSIGALAIILSLALWDWKQFKNASDRVRETEDSLRQMELILSTAKDAETGQRGYLITGDERYLNPYKNAQANLPRELADPRIQALRQSSLRDVLANLQKALAEKLAEIQQTIDLQREGLTDAALTIVRNDSGKLLMDDIRIYCRAIEDSLRNQLATRERLAETQTRQARLFSAAASCFLFVLVALATVKFRKEKEAAEAANRTKSTFLANMSHELRTPLNAIIGYSEMLLEEAEDTGQTALVADVHKILMAGRHLLELINAVLDLSKIEAGKMELYLETFGVSTLVEDVTSVIKPLIEKNGNTLQVSIDPAAGAMRSDQTKLRQSLYNLLSNAAKFTSGGVVLIDVRVVSDDRISFAVTDSGVGMSPEQLAKLFEPFAQGDASTSRKYGGTGLGLAISRRFARMLNGDISVESSEGKGSTFTLIVPRNPETENSHAADTTPRQSVNRPTVLVIDDEPAVHEILARTLSRYGFRVEGALTGEEGLRAARKLRPQIITLDVMMPGMDGWAVLAALKSDRNLAEIPVIMLTIVDDRNLGYSLGAADYLTKPIDRERLASVLLRYKGNEKNSLLVVEDDPASRDMLRRMLENEGWLVAEADNGKTALGQLAKERPSVVLLDLMMPEMDGFEFIEEMNRHAEWKSIPVIVITARDLTKEDRARLNGHVSRVLQKGLYSRDELLHEVGDLVTSRIRKSRNS